MTRRFSFQLDDQLLERLSLAANAAEVSQARYVVAALREFLEDRLPESMFSVLASLRRGPRGPTGRRGTHRRRARPSMKRGSRPSASGRRSG